MEVDRIVNSGGKSKGKSGKGKRGRGRGWWSFGSYALQGRGRGGKSKGRGNKGKGKSKQKGKSKGKYDNGGKSKGKQKGKQLDAQQCRLCFEYGHWSRDCPNRMVNQVTNAGPGQQEPVHGQPQQHQNVPTGSSQPRVSSQSNYVGTASTSSTVRRIFNIPMGLPSLSSNPTSTIRMISNEAKHLDERNTIILDSGAGVSLMPHCLGVEVDGPADGAEVQLKVCQGSALKVSGVKVASLVVEDVDGSQAELETQFVVSDGVKSCILSLGQLYRAG